VFSGWWAPAEPDVAIHLDNCLESFFSKELLTGKNQYHCRGTCKKKRQASKKVSCRALPQILVIHLKRFTHNDWSRKINTRVVFPMDGLDMARFTEKGKGTRRKGACVYDLAAVIQHEGTAETGHYLSYCKHPINDTWFRYDDANFEEVSEQEVLESQAYILFYQRRVIRTSISNNQVPRPLLRAFHSSGAKVSATEQGPTDSPLVGLSEVSALLNAKQRGQQTRTVLQPSAAFRDVQPPQQSIEMTERPRGTEAEDDFPAAGGQYDDDQRPSYSDESPHSPQSSGGGEDSLELRVDSDPNEPQDAIVFI